MPRATSRSLPSIVAGVVAFTIASLGGVSGATAEPDGSFIKIPQTCYDVSDPVEGLPLATADLSQPLIGVFATNESAPEALQAPAAEPSSDPGMPSPTAESDASGPSVLQVGRTVEMDDPMEGFGLAAGLFDAATLGVADEEVLPEVVQLAFADSTSGREERQALSVQIRKEEILEEYDPWQPFNEGTFSFNRHFDRFLLKPVATVWDKILPDFVQQSLGNAFENLGMPRRLVNNLLQLKLKGAGQELARFLLNTTFGFAGFFDPAKELGIEKSDEDTGQTLGVYGAGPGPYLILPLLPPLTVRDGIGFVIDLALDPLNYVLPFAALAGKAAGRTVNERSLNLELYESVEETVLDLYTAVRNGYLQRRQKAIEE